jgi:hypothetical protein
VTCKWDSEAQDYLTPDGDKCRHDEYGDPTKHCTARRTCSMHVGPEELTCARCVGRTRMDLRQIAQRSTELLDEAIEVGVNSEAANLAGPATDAEAWSWHKVSAKQGRIWHVSLVEDDDEHHPVTVTAVWCRMLAEDYGLDCPDLSNLAGNVAYLERLLGRVAQDPEQDFPLMAREIRKCRAHLESVLRDSLSPERGAPCPTCAKVGVFVRLAREYSHWCTDEECTQPFHSTTDDFDVWICPRNKDHWWNPQGYADMLEERQAERTSA